MPDDLRYKPLGRISEPSADVAPPGSLLKAENCVIRSAGIVDPLPETRQLTSSDGPTGRGVWQQSPQFDNGGQPEQLLHVANGVSANNGVRKSSAMATEITYTDADGNSASIEPYDHGDAQTFYPMHIARNNLYLADQSGCYKWQSTDDATLEPLHDWIPSVSAATNASLTNKFLANNSHVGYRSVLVFEDSNGVIRRSIPSVPVRLNNTTGSAVDATVTVAIRENWYDQISTLSRVEIYRTRVFANTVTLPNEYYLVGDIPASSLTLSSPQYTATFSDEVVDGDVELSALLYTSAGAEGEVSANYVPPEHFYHAQFRGHEFWANTSSAETVSLGMTSTRVSDGDTATRDGSTAVLTGIGSTFLMAAGQTIQGTGIPSDAYIVSVDSGTQITISAATTSAGTNTITVHDAVYVRYPDGTTDRMAIVDIENPNGTAGNTRPNPSYTAISYLSRDLVAPSAYKLEFDLLHINRTGRQGVSQIWVNNPSNFGQEFADLGATNGAPTTGGTEFGGSQEARIYWSKFQEPEVTTLGYSAAVGNASGIGGGQIVGLGALREALIILKSDGVFRLTGDNGNWRIDPLDTSVRIIGGRSTQVMDNAVYTLSDRGLLRITSQGVENLSDGIVGDWFAEDSRYSSRPRLENVRTYMVNNSGYHPPGLFSAADQTNREYYLVVEGSDSPLGDGTTDEILIYNAKTGAFTTAEISESDAFNISSLGYVRGDYSNTSGTRQAPGVSFGRQVSGADTSAAVFLFDNRAESLPHNTWTQDVRFRAATADDSTHEQLWVDSAFSLAEAPDAGTLCVFSTDEDDAGPTTVAATEDRQIRCWVPRGHARGEQLVVGLQGANVRLRGVRLTYRSSGRRPPVATD